MQVVLKKIYPLTGRLCYVGFFSGYGCHLSLLVAVFIKISALLRSINIGRQSNNIYEKLGKVSERALYS